MNPGEAVTVHLFGPVAGRECPQCGDDTATTRKGFGCRVRRHCGYCQYRWTECEDYLSCDIHHPAVKS